MKKYIPQGQPASEKKTTSPPAVKKLPEDPRFKPPKGGGSSLINN